MDHGGGDLNNGGLGLHVSACMATGQSPLAQASPGVVYAKCRPVYDDSIAEDKCTKRQSLIPPCTCTAACSCCLPINSVEELKVTGWDVMALSAQYGYIVPKTYNSVTSWI